MMSYFAVAGGGAMGAVTRLAMSGAVQRAVGGSFPWGTLTVNVLGAFLMGVIVGGSLRLWTLTPELRLFLTTGLLGGFTTFSAFSLETVLMVQKSAWVPAIAYALGSVVLTVLFLFLGLWAVRAISV